MADRAIQAVCVVMALVASYLIVRFDHNFILRSVGCILILCGINLLRGIQRRRQKRLLQASLERFQAEEESGA